jgi:hypothetical protein
MLVYVLGTKFGAMFDMLVDRCSTMCLCFVLAMFYPEWALFFQLWAAIDVASHWLHLHASVVHPIDRFIRMCCVFLVQQSKVQKVIRKSIYQAIQYFVSITHHAYERIVCFCLSMFYSVSDF